MQMKRMKKYVTTVIHILHALHVHEYVDLHILCSIASLLIISFSLIPY